MPPRPAVCTLSVDRERCQVTWEIWGGGGGLKLSSHQYTFDVWYCLRLLLEMEVPWKKYRVPFCRSSAIKMFTPAKKCYTFTGYIIIKTACVNNKHHFWSQSTHLVTVLAMSFCSLTWCSVLSTKHAQNMLIIWTTGGYFTIPTFLKAAIPVKHRQPWEGP